MIKPKTTLPITDIVLDETIYPRARIDQKRAEKHNWPLPLVWSLSLEGKDDHERFKQLNWGLRAWDLWGWPDCDKRFGDDWPGRERITWPFWKASLFSSKSIQKKTRLAFINADWRNFQHKPAFDEVPEDAILIDDYLSLLHKTGWHRTHHIQAPLSSERFEAGVVSAMQNKRILGVTSRYIIVTKQH